MKHYNTDFIKKYITDNKDQIDSVFCFMAEDVPSTSDVVFADSDFKKGFNWKSQYLKVRGIDGSTWATPSMEIWFKDGKIKEMECWIDDGESAPMELIVAQKTLVRAIAGMFSI